MKKILLYLSLLVLPIITFAQQMPIGYCDPGPCVLSQFDKNFMIAHGIFIFILVVSLLICLLYFISRLIKRKIISRNKFFVSIIFVFIGLVGLYILPIVKTALGDSQETIVLPCVPDEFTKCDDHSNTKLNNLSIPEIIR